MSLDRAYVNCKRCCKLIGEDAMEGRNMERDNDVYSARNDALQAMQDYLYNFQLHIKRMGQDDDVADQQARQAVRSIVEACKKCNYLKPALANKIQQLFGE